ncbi:MAG: hypothetical protein WKG06_22825 [Segetibacter sp.]
MKDYFSIGKIAATHGLTGEVVLQHALGEKTDLKGLQTIFIEEKRVHFYLILLRTLALKMQEKFT